MAALLTTSNTWKSPKFTLIGEYIYGVWGKGEREINRQKQGRVEREKESDRKNTERQNGHRKGKEENSHNFPKLVYMLEHSQNVHPLWKGECYFGGCLTRRQECLEPFTGAKMRYLNLNLNVRGGPGKLCARGVIYGFY